MKTPTVATELSITPAGPEDNSAGRALYDAAGFMVVGRWADYYRRAGGDHAAALVMRTEITPS